MPSLANFGLESGTESKGRSPLFFPFLTVIPGMTLSKPITVFRGDQVELPPWKTFSLAFSPQNGYSPLTRNFLIITGGPAGLPVIYVQNLSEMSSSSLPCHVANQSPRPRPYLG